MPYQEFPKTELDHCRNGLTLSPGVFCRSLAQINKPPKVPAALVQKCIWTRELRKSFKEVFGSTRNAERTGPNTATLDPLC